MKTVELKLPEAGLFAITRVALGVGLGLLLSERMEEEQRRAAGIALLAIGVLTTIPFVVRIFGED